MLHGVCIVHGAVDCAVGVTGACNTGILGINHHAVLAQHVGCSMGGVCMLSEGIRGWSGSLVLYHEHYAYRMYFSTFVCPP